MGADATRGARWRRVHACAYTSGHCCGHLQGWTCTEAQYYWPSGVFVISAVRACQYRVLRSLVVRE